jgi:hypothetical protein
VADGKKPFNPVLGETCAWTYQHADAHSGVTRMVCEQVSHHPPISAMHIHNESLGVTLEGAAQIDAKFMGNSVLVPFKGVRRLTIKGTNEIYHLTYPSLQYRGVMLGPKGAEWIGKVEIRCPHTKLVAKLEFKPMGWLGMWGAWHRVEGAIKSVGGKKEVVGAISGCWDKGVFSLFLPFSLLCSAIACHGKRLAPLPTKSDLLLNFQCCLSAAHAPESKNVCTITRCLPQCPARTAFACRLDQSLPQLRVNCSPFRFQFLLPSLPLPLLHTLTRPSYNVPVGVIACQASNCADAWCISADRFPRCLAQSEPGAACKGLSNRQQGENTRILDAVG